MSEKSSVRRSIPLKLAALRGTPSTLLLAVAYKRSPALASFGFSTEKPSVRRSIPLKLAALRGIEPLLPG